MFCFLLQLVSLVHKFSIKTIKGYRGVKFNNIRFKSITGFTHLKLIVVVMHTLAELFIDFLHAGQCMATEYNTIYAFNDIISCFV